MVSSGRPTAPYRRVTSDPSSVPTVRLTLRTGSSSRTGNASSSAPSASWMSVRSSARSSPWSCARTRRRCGTAAPAGDSAVAKIGLRSSPRLFQCATPAAVPSTSGCPTASSMLRKPRSARCRRTSSATNRKKSATNSGRPVNRLRNSGFCVATPTGQVSRWHTRIMMQPAAISGAVENPYSSAPSSIATTTSRAVRSPPSHCIVIRSRNPPRTNVCCASARPISHGNPACSSDVSGDAPVPPS
ncbi:hypothetical protein RHDE110596_14450 [Prescottella defluvii]